jgi:hypothetical protein
MAPPPPLLPPRRRRTRPRPGRRRRCPEAAATSALARRARCCAAGRIWPSAARGASAPRLLRSSSSAGSGCTCHARWWWMRSVSRHAAAAQRATTRARSPPARPSATRWVEAALASALASAEVCLVAGHVMVCGARAAALPSKHRQPSPLSRRAQTTRPGHLHPSPYTHTTARGRRPPGCRILRIRLALRRTEAAACRARRGLWRPRAARAGARHWAPDRGRAACCDRLPCARRERLRARVLRGRAAADAGRPGGGDALCDAHRRAL